MKKTDIEQLKKGSAIYVNGRSAFYRGLTVNPLTGQTRVQVTDTPRAKKFNTTSLQSVGKAEPDPFNC